MTVWQKVHSSQAGYSVRSVADGPGRAETPDSTNPVGDDIYGRFLEEGIAIWPATLHRATVSSLRQFENTAPPSAITCPQIGQYSGIT